MKQMQAKLRTIDFIIEVHDARIPFSGRNINFQNLLGIKPRILVFNKKDLVDKTCYEQIIKKVSDQEKDVVKVLFTSANQIKDHSLLNILPIILDHIKISNRYNRMGADEYNIMIIGVPNVGKSSLLNAFRNKYMKKSKASEEGPYAGVTKSVLNKIKVYPNPKVFVFDTPGIMAPHISSSEAAMRLALCATFKDSLIGEKNMCDYLLYWLNKRKLMNEYTHCGELNLPLSEVTNANKQSATLLHEKSHNLKFPDTILTKENNEIDMKIYGPYLNNKPTDNILDYLIRVAIVNQRFVKVRKVIYDGNSESINNNQHWEFKPDINTAANLFLKTFRSGKMGKFILDDDI
ncbi:unnamed protein product [Gordionus sp. m RMFG-2023]